MNNNIEKPIENDLNSLESSLKDDPFFADSNSKKGKTFIIKIIAGVVGLVLISGGAVLASRAWDPVWNPFRPSPEKVLSKMINNDSAKNLHINSNISFVKKGSESVGISMTSSEDLDSNDEKNIKSKGSFDMVIESEGIQFLIGLESLSNGTDSFFKINKVPTIPGFGLDFSFLKNQWIKNESKSSFNKDILKDVSVNNFIIKNELPDEKINGKKVYHYVVGFKEEGIDQLIDKIYESINDELSSSMMGEVVDTSELENGKNELRTILSGVEVEVWIGKKDYSLYRIKMNEKELDEDWFIAFDMEFSELTEPLIIEIPSDYSTMEEVMMALMFGGFSDNEDLPFDRMRKKASDLFPIFNPR